jgi:homoserine kinase type II
MTGRRAITGINASELAGVCARYDIGQLQSARPFVRGSGSAPKVLLETSTGQYLLKRRARGAGRDDPFRVALSHEIQLHLAERGFPVAELIGTRGDHNTMLQLSGHVYELFRFVAGEPDDRSPAAAGASGAALAGLHSILRDFRPTWTPPLAPMRAAPEIISRLEAIPLRTGDPQTRRPVAELKAAYCDAWERALELGIGAMPRQLIHGDWHPGNMLFTRRDGTLHLLAVVDFDSARMAPRVYDVAMGALQFGLPRTRTGSIDDKGSRIGSDSEQIPSGLDIDRLDAYFGGYHGAAEPALSPAETGCISWLMLQALVAETAVPIAATGRLGRVDGPTFLRVAEQKARWLVDNRTRLVAMIARAGDSRHAGARP